MSELARFRFSLATFMLVVMWSAVALGIITQHRVELWKVNDREVVVTYYGWPFVCAVGEWTDLPSHHLSFLYWRLVGDVVVGLLLVSVLTWGSGYLLRRANHGYRRRQSPPVLETLARYYYEGPWYWRVVGDAVVVVMLVIVLSWGSRCLQRCIQHVFCRVESSATDTTMGE